MHMNRFVCFFILLFTATTFHSCTVNNVTEDDKLGKVFEANGVKGTFGMFDNSRGQFTIYDLEGFKAADRPGQTTNILTTLIAIHTGKLSDEASTLTDSTGITLSIDSVFKANSGAHFQALVQLIGRDTLKAWVDTVKYGNKKIGKADAHWADSLTISPDEQLGLIKRLYFRQLQFRASVQEAVKKMMVVENNAQHQFAYQTASIPTPKGQTAWVIGWIEENRHVYPFSLKFEADAEADTEAIGSKLIRDLLADLGFFKGIM